MSCLQISITPKAVNDIKTDLTGGYRITMFPRGPLSATADVAFQPRRCAALPKIDDRIGYWRNSRAAYGLL